LGRRDALVARRPSAAARGGERPERLVRPTVIPTGPTSGAARRDYLDWLLILGSRHLEWVVHEDVRCNGRVRPHPGTAPAPADTRRTARRARRQCGPSRPDRAGGLRRSPPTSRPRWA